MDHDHSAPAEPALSPSQLLIASVKQEAAALTKPFDEWSSNDIDVSGKHTFIDASNKADIRLVFQFFREYEVPQTSACLLVPDWPKARFNHYLKGGQLLKQYPGGTIQKYPVKLVHMLVKQVQLSALSDDALCMTFQGRAAGYPALVAADSQASHVFIRRSLIERSGAHMTPVNETVKLADGISHAGLIGICAFKLQIGPLHDSVRAYVMNDLASHHDVILGQDWLIARKAVLNYEHMCMSVKKGDRKYTLKSFRVPHVPVMAQDSPVLMSAAQVKRALAKHADNSFLVMVRDVQEEDDGPDPSKPLAGPANLPEDADKHIGNGICDRSAIRALLKKFEHVSKTELPGLPPDRPEFRAEPIIRLKPGAQPPAPRMYRLSPSEKKEVERQVAQMLRQGLIQPSSSPYGAPMLFVPKPNGALRGVFDWRALNALSIRDVSPLPRIDDLIDQLRGSKVWSSTDFTQGYYQVRLHPDDVPKTAFKTHIGLYEFKVIAMGLSGSPAAF